MKVYPHREVYLLNKIIREEFKVNEQRVKAYHGESLHNTRITLDLHESS